MRGVDTCQHCSEPNCLFNYSSRPSNHDIEGIVFDTCGRYLPAGEYVAVQRGPYAFAFCRKCYWAAMKAGVGEEHFDNGDLAKCIPCGYYPARIKAAG